MHIPIAVIMVEKANIVAQMDIITQIALPQQQGTPPNS